MAIKELSTIQNSLAKKNIRTHAASRIFFFHFINQNSRLKKNDRSGREQKTAGVQPSFLSLFLLSDPHHGSLLLAHAACRPMKNNKNYAKSAISLPVPLHTLSAHTACRPMSQRTTSKTKSAISLSALLRSVARSPPHARRIPTHGNHSHTTTQTKPTSRSSTPPSAFFPAAVPTAPASVGDWEKGSGA